MLVSLRNVVNACNNFHFDPTFTATYVSDAGSVHDGHVRGLVVRRAGDAEVPGLRGASVRRPALLDGLRPLHRLHSQSRAHRLAHGRPRPQVHPHAAGVHGHRVLGHTRPRPGPYRHLRGEVRLHVV